MSFYNESIKESISAGVRIIKFCKKLAGLYLGNNSAVKIPKVNNSENIILQLCYKELGLIEIFSNFEFDNGVYITVLKYVSLCGCDFSFKDSTRTSNKGHCHFK